MTHQTFTSFEAAAKAIVVGSVSPICARVMMFSDIINRDVEFRGHTVQLDGCVWFKPDSARVSWQLASSK